MCECFRTLKSPRPHCRGRAVGCPKRICRICRFCRVFFAGLRIYPYLWVAMASCQGRLIPEFPVCGIQMELTSAKIRAPFFLCIEDKIYIVTKNYKWTHLKKCHLPLFTPYRSIFEAQVFQNTTISSGLNLKNLLAQPVLNWANLRLQRYPNPCWFSKLFFLGLLRSCFELFVWRLGANSSPAAHLKEHFKQLKTASK